MRRFLLEELAKEHEEKGKDEEAQRVHNMLANKKERERAQHLAQIKNSENKGGVMSVCVDRVDRNSDGNIALNADGTER
eukprot:1385683-Ditylum_brightwellii.AAC.1